MAFLQDNDDDVLNRIRPIAHQPQHLALQYPFPHPQQTRRDKKMIPTLLPIPPPHKTHRRR